MGSDLSHPRPATALARAAIEIIIALVCLTGFHRDLISPPKITELQRLLPPPLTPHPVRPGSAKIASSLAVMGVGKGRGEWLGCGGKPAPPPPHESPGPTPTRTCLMAPLLPV